MAFFANFLGQRVHPDAQVQGEHRGDCDHVGSRPVPIKGDSHGNHGRPNGDLEWVTFDDLHHLLDEGIKQPRIDHDPKEQDGE